MPEFSVYIPIIAKNLTAGAVAGVNKGINSVTRNLTKLNVSGARLQQIGTNMSTAGRKMVIAGAAIAVPLALATRATANFETGIAKVSTLLKDDVQQTMVRYGGQIKDLAVKTGSSTDDLNEALFRTISAGVKTTKAMDFLEISAKAAVGGFTDVDTAVSGLTTVLNSYNLSAEHTGRIADQLFIANELGVLTFGELASSIGAVSTVAATLNVSTGDLLSGITAITKAGRSTSEAVTGVNAIFTALTTKTKEADEALEQMNRNLPGGKKFEFTTSALQRKGFLNWFRELAKATGGSMQLIEKLFRRVEAKTAVAALLSQMNTFEDAADRMDKATNKATLTTSNYNKAMGTLNKRLDILKSSLNVLGIETGEMLVPVLTKVVEKMKSNIDGARLWSKENPKLAASIANATLKLSAFLLVGGTVAGLMGNLVKLAGTLKIAFLALSGTIVVPIAIAAGFLVAIGYSIKKLRDLAKSEAVSRGKLVSLRRLDRPAPPKKIGADMVRVTDTRTGKEIEMPKSQMTRILAAKSPKAAMAEYLEKQKAEIATKQAGEKQIKAGKKVQNELLSQLQKRLKAQQDLMDKYDRKAKDKAIKEIAYLSPEIRGRMLTEEFMGAGFGQAAGGGQGRIINISTLNMPGVTNGQGMLDELDRLSETGTEGREA